MVQVQSLWQVLRCWQLLVELLRLMGISAGHVVAMTARPFRDCSRRGGERGGEESKAIVLAGAVRDRSSNLVLHGCRGFRCSA